jgi:hypothetical protein
MLKLVWIMVVLTMATSLHAQCDSAQTKRLDSLVVALSAENMDLWYRYTDCCREMSTFAEMQSIHDSTAARRIADANWAADQARASGPLWLSFGIGIGLFVGLIVHILLH